MKRPSDIFYGWWIVAITLTINSLKHGSFNRGFTVYFLPIQNELGISRAAYSMAEGLSRLEGGIQAPVLGYLIDRLGPRIMLSAGGAVSGLGFILLYFTHSYLYFLLIFVGLLSAGFRGGYDNASIPTVTQWFRRKRGLAVSIVSTCNGLGGAVITPLVGLMVLNLGWRASAIISGIVILAVVIPLSLLVRRSPETMGLLPDGDSTSVSRPILSTRRQQELAADPVSSGIPATGTTSSRTSADPDFKTKEALSTRSYWLFALTVSLSNGAFTAILWHLVPLLVWSGVSATAAAFFVGAMSFNTLFFNPCVGWMGDRWSKQRICSGAMVAGVLGLFVLMASNGKLWQLAIFVILMAAAETNNPLNWAILADLFGRRSYATLHGWLNLPSQLISMITPIWAGWVFDQTDSYFWALVPFAVMFSLAAILYWNLPRPQIPERLSPAYGTQIL